MPGKAQHDLGPPELRTPKGQAGEPPGEIARNSVASVGLDDMLQHCSTLNPALDKIIASHVHQLAMDQQYA